MKIQALPATSSAEELNPLVFTGINDTPDNPRLGLGYHQLYDLAKPVGLIARLPEVTRVGDTITLYWDTRQVQTYDLDQATIDKGWLSFSVLPTEIEAPEGRTYYTLYDNEADDLRTSPERTIRVNRQPPGGLDPNTDTPFNESLTKAAIRPPLISSKDTRVTVTVVPWINMLIGDELTVLWNGLRVDRPPLTSVGVPQDVIIPPAVIEAGGSNVKLPVSYEIRDIVDNYSLPAPLSFVDVDIDPNALIAPRVSEANQQTLVLDLEALGDKDAHVLIPNYGVIRAGDQITLTWVGRVGNTEVTLTLGPKTVDDPHFGPLPVFEIPNDHLKSIAGGSAVVSYQVTRSDQVTRSGEQTLNSKRTSITLTGLPVPLAAPQLYEATGTVIDLRTLSGPDVHVDVAAYFGKSAGDKIILIWSGETENGDPVNYPDEHLVQPGEENRGYRFIVNRLNLDPLIRGTLTLQYQIIFSGTTSPVDSQVSSYTVIGADSFKEGFDGQTPRLIKAGGSISTDLVTINFISGAGSAGFPAGDTLPPQPGPLRLPVLHVCFQNPIIDPGTQTLEIDLKSNFTTFECDVHGPNETTTIELLNSAKAVIYTLPLGSEVNYHFKHTDASRSIRYVRIVADKDWTRWDNFVMNT